MCAYNTTHRPMGKMERKQRGYNDMTWWDPYVENITDEDTYLRRKFRQDVTDKSTGIPQEAFAARLDEIVAQGRASGEPWRVTKARCFAAQILEQSIDVSPLDWFPAMAIWDRLSLPIRKLMGRRAEEVNAERLSPEVVKEWRDGNADGRWLMWQDFDHSVPDWRVILSLGFPGMKARLAAVAATHCAAATAECTMQNAQCTMGGGRVALPRDRGRDEARPSQEGDSFYKSCFIAMDAILAGIDRFIAQGKRNLELFTNGNCHNCSQIANTNSSVDFAAKSNPVNPVNPVKNNSASLREIRLAREIACLERLRDGPPQTAYDMMMFVWIYFFFSEHLDGIQCRSLTELDAFIAPYYEADIAAGRTTEVEFREQMRHFLWQWGSAANYYAQPIGYGGTRRNGTSEFGEVSRIILEIADELNLTSPKFIVKVADNTPDWAWRQLLDMARRRRSVAFLGEESAAKALRRWKDACDEDCRTMAVRGCYEFGLCDSLNTTDAANLNLLMPVVRILEEANALRLPDYKSFLAEYLRRVAEVTTRSRELVGELEKVLSEVNPANLMTLATEHALRNRKDGFADGCPRGNDTTIRALGLGSAVDALLAVKELVYEKGEVTLAELGAITAANWEGNEELRRRMSRSKRKWGNNDGEANAFGARIIETFASNMNGFPNSRGGIFLASGHSSRRFIELGRKTPASPDGRRAGEELSKNLSPTMGADTEGATALVSTLASSSAELLPSDYPLDVLLHPSVCQGEEGLEAMRALVRVYHLNGGGVIQFTVFSVEELRDAQAHPEKYESLQVRICGWNVRWNDMCKAEQDAYIRRAENVACWI